MTGSVIDGEAGPIDDKANILAAERALGLGSDTLADAVRPSRPKPRRCSQRDAATEERPAVEGNKMSHVVLRAPIERQKRSLRGAARSGAPTD